MFLRGWARRGIRAWLWTLAVIGMASPAISQAWPSKPITLIVPFAAGGAPDIMARFLAQDLSNRLRQRVLVKNRVGAGGDIGAAAVARSPQDGYTLLLGTNAPIILNKAVYQALNHLRGTCSWRQPKARCLLSRD